GKISVGSGGNGSPAHVTGELFKMMTGVNLTHVPYRGAGPAITDLLGGQIQVTFTDMAASIEYIRAGKLRALAVTTATRSEALPDIPTVGDFVSGFEASQWVGLCERWSEIDWKARQITKLGKGGRRVTVPITATIRDILWPLRGHHPDFVFTYVCQRARGGRSKGARYPLNYYGVQSCWQRVRKLAGVTGFRFHDHRHDFATKLLRETGNLKLVQKALNHRNIRSTLRYAHVLDSEVAEAMERVAKSRNRSRSGALRIVKPLAG